MRKTSLSLLLIIGGPVLFATLFLTARLLAFSATKPTTTPAAGFTWSMRERFGMKDANGLVNYHWNSEKEAYEDSYVHPPSWTVDFEGCAGAPPQSAFRWEVDGQLLTETKCAFSHDFPSLKSHVVRLTVTAPDGQSSSTETNVFLKDLFIVSVGDSFASGEGNPDVPRNDEQNESHKARWIDERCHRSSWAGPARAAMIIEKADPHSSVTFISFACSGAGINAGLLHGQPRGSRSVKPQLDKIFETAGERLIDALLVSIGGNDVSFDKLVERAIALPHADRHKGTNELFENGMKSLPGLFAQMSDRLTKSDNKTKVANIFITEYPDMVRDETRDYCDHSVHFPDPLFGINGEESEWALNKIIKPLDALIEKEVTDRGWKYVGGILSEFGEDSITHVAHGFCADDKRWVNTFEDSWKFQHDYKGTVHPNNEGQLWYAQRLVGELRAKGIGLAG